MSDQPEVTIPLQRGALAPPAGYVELLERCPVSQVGLEFGGTAWAVTRHADVRAMLIDRRLSSDRTRRDFPILQEGQYEASVSGPAGMIGMDAPEHTAARREVLGEFTVRRIQALRPRIQEITDEFTDRMLAGPRPADLVEALALPVPSLVICELLGVPYADHDFFQDRSSRLISNDLPAADRQQAIGELLAYLGELIARKEREPADDLVSRQIRRQQEEGGVRHGDLVVLALLLLIGGHETTANMISLGVMALLEHPDALAAIQAEPDRIPAAVEELLRYLSIVDLAVARVAVADTEIGGTPVRAGEGVIPLLPAANRDPAAFPDPGRLDIGRDARHHVAFGYGAHQCIGQNLARTELQVVFATLFRKAPGLRLAIPAADVPLKDNALIFGARELPVTW